MKIKTAELQSLVTKVLSSKHYSNEEAIKIAEVLMFAELTGKNTQGILKLLNGKESIQEVKPKYLPKIIKETSLSVLVDGGGAAGALAAQFGLEKVIEKGKEHGVGIVGVNNTFSSVGALSFYAYKIAQANLIGIVMAGSPRSVAHHGGIDPVYGTNPMGFGFPTMSDPIVFDMATSGLTWYGLVRAKALGQKIPKNVAIDQEGNLTVDPEAAMKGALLPFDNSYKGSGLGMVVELFTGPFGGASYVFDKGDWGTSLIVISPDLTVGIEEFKKHSSQLVKKVTSRRSKSKIHIPGESINKSLKASSIEIDEKLLTELKKLAK